MPAGTRRIQLTRNILIKGKHTQKGAVLDAPEPLAASLVGEGSAEYHEKSAAAVAEENRAGVKVHEPVVQSGDPGVRVVSDAAPDADAKPKADDKSKAKPGK